MRSRLLGAVALAVALTVSTSAQAQPIQFFFASNGVFGNTFTIPAIGGTVDVQVWMNDTGAASSFFANPNQTQNLDTNGLFGAGLRITSGSPGVARVNAAADCTPNPGWTFFNPNPPQNGNFAAVNAAAGTVDAFGSQLNPLGLSTGGTGRILFGTFHFTALAVGSTALTFADNDPTFQATSLGHITTPATNGGAVLDPTPPGTPAAPGLFSNTATIIVGVPEPTSLALVGLGAAGLAWVRRRKATQLAV